MQVELGSLAFPYTLARMFIGELLGGHRWLAVLTIVLAKVPLQVTIHPAPDAEAWTQASQRKTNRSGGTGGSEVPLSLVTAGRHV